MTNVNLDKVANARKIGLVIGVLMILSAISGLLGIASFSKASIDMKVLTLLQLIVSGMLLYTSFYLHKDYKMIKLFRWVCYAGLFLAILLASSMALNQYNQFGFTFVIIITFIIVTSIISIPFIIMIRKVSGVEMPPGL